MQRYEVVAIVLADVSDEDITALIDRTQAVITDRKGVIAKVDKWGKKHLAYEIKKQRDGYYFLIDFAGDGAIVSEIERTYKIDDRVIKFITVKKEGACTREGIDKEIADAEAKRTQARAESEAAAEARAAGQSERPQREGRLYIKKNKEEVAPKGE